MEEQILKIICKNVNPVPIGTNISLIGVNRLPKKITSHVMEFVEWLRIVTDNGNYTWDIGDNKDYSSGEIYLYWLINIKK